MKLIIGLFFIALGILGALYISVYWGLIQPILSLCQMYDAHTLTGSVIAGELVKFLLRDILAAVWGIVFWLIGGAIITVK